MFCFHYFIFFSFLNCQILQLNAFDEEHNDIFAELWQKIGTKSSKCKETLRTNSNDDFISQKIGKIKKEIVVKDEPYDYDDQFSNERQQKIALNKTVKEENVEKRVKSEFMEFDGISDKEEFDNGKDGEEQSTDSYSLFDNSNLKERSSNTQKEKQKRHTDVEKVELLKKFYKIKKENPQLRNDEIAQMLNVHIKTLNRWERKSKGLEPGIKKIYSEAEKQEIIAELDHLKQKFKARRVKGMSYDMKKVYEKMSQKLGVAIRTIYKWKNECGARKNRKNYTDAERVELLKNFNKIKKENPQHRKDEIAQMLNIHITTLNRWERESKGLKGIKKIYSEEEKREIIAEFYKFKNEFKTQAKGMPYDMKKIEKKIARKLGVSRCTIYCWKKQFGDSSQINAATANKITM